MTTLHNYLIRTLSAYHNWHQIKHHNKIHWGVLVVFTLLIFGTISRWTPISLAADTISPSTPTNLTATAISSTQINLSWTASTDDVGVAGYKIYRCAGSICTPTTQIATSATNSYSNTGVTASTAYTYAVSAYDAAGNESGKSTSASATTQAQTGNTYYVDPASPSPGSGYKSWETAAHDIKTGLQAMAGGDTLIIRDGIYTGADNMIGAYNIPPSADITSGTPEAYTVVRAENDFMVIIDAQQVNNRRPCSINGSYIEVHGIECRNPGDMSSEQQSSPVYVNGHHIKLFRVGAVEAGQQANDPGWGDMSNIFTLSRTSYVLLEECYAFGWGKYVFLLYQADHTIIRRCVGRQDGWAWGVGDIFSNYSSSFTEFQNNIAIDMSEARHWHPQVRDALWGGFNINETSAVPSNDINYRGNIAINITGTNGVTIRDANGISHGADSNPSFRLGGNNITMENNVISNSVSGPITYDDVTIGNNTFVNIFNDNSSNFSIDGTGVWYVKNAQPIVTNTVFVSNENVAAQGISIVSDYNAYYGNAMNYGGGSIAGPNDKSLEKGNEINPLWSSTNPSGGLKYPVRIEAGSNLSGRGQGGADIGANIKTKIGVSGTLYGEPGYNVDTGEPLWPFPNEDIIKQRMAAYSRWDPYDNIDPNNPSNPDTYVKGKRGFSADGTGLYGGPITLTSYIWESLGNPCPAGICVSIPDTTPPTTPTNLAATAVSSTQINLSWIASTDNVGVTGYKIYRCSGTGCTPTTQISTSAINSYSNTGLTASTVYTYAVSAYDAANNESEKSSSVSATTFSQFKQADFNKDGVVNQLDFDILKQEWSRTDKPVSDLNQDGIVDSRDLGIMMSEWTR